MREGGCICGAVRYTLASPPFNCGYCHCRICQRASGAPVIVFASVAQDDLAYTQGADLVGTYRATSFGTRAYCTRCGSQLTIKLDEDSTVDISVATLDDPAAVPPGFHIYTESRQPWLRIADSLPRYARGRRDSEPGSGS